MSGRYKITIGIQSEERSLESGKDPCQDLEHKPDFHRQGFKINLSKNL